MSPKHVQGCPKKKTHKNPVTCSYCKKERRIAELARQRYFEEHWRELPY